MRAVIALRLAAATAFLVLILAALVGERYLTRGVSPTAPVVFRHATITTETGFLRENMIVAVANGRVVFVSDGRNAPALPAGAREVDARTAMVAAATFDHSVRSPLDGLRHVWAGQLHEGAPGDLVVTTVNPGRRRSQLPEPREILAAIVNGRYYSAADLAKER